MIKKLLSSVRQYKKPALLAPLYVTVESVLEIIIPTLMAYLIDRGIQPKDMHYVLRMGLILVVFAAFSLLTGILAGRSAAVASAEIGRASCRERVFRSG